MVTCSKYEVFFFTMKHLTQKLSMLILPLVFLFFVLIPGTVNATCGYGGPGFFVCTTEAEADDKVSSWPSLPCIIKTYDRDSSGHTVSSGRIDGYSDTLCSSAWCYETVFFGNSGCTDGNKQFCTTSKGCRGTQICSGGHWGVCQSTDTCCGDSRCGKPVPSPGDTQHIAVAGDSDGGICPAQ